MKGSLLYPPKTKSSRSREYYLGQMPPFAVFLLLACLSSAAAAHASRSLLQGYRAPEISVTATQLKEALKNVTHSLNNSGGGNEMWATIVNRDGTVKYVVFSGRDRAANFPISRIVSATKAYTANSVSLNNFALSSANLYGLTQAGGTLFGLPLTSPVDASIAYAGNPDDFGTEKDPVIKKRVGGIAVFGGGLAIYNSYGQVIGGLGVSGDTACTDHIVAWKVRSMLKLDYVRAGHAGLGYDNLGHGNGTGPLSHPVCDDLEQVIIADLPRAYPIRKP